MTHLAGTSRWWNGPLDVEGLALGSVRAAAASASLYAGAPGRFSTTPDLTAAAFDSSGLLRIAGRKAQGFAPLSGFRQTLDGWIRIHANYPHHERAAPAGSWCCHGRGRGPGPAQHPLPGS